MTASGLAPSLLNWNRTYVASRFTDLLFSFPTMFPAAETGLTPNGSEACPQVFITVPPLGREGEPMDLRYIQSKREGRVAIGYLNKPRTNTYDPELMRDLNYWIDEVRYDEDVDVAVLSSSSDGMFSAGADINFLRASTPDHKATFCLGCQATLNKMESTPKLFIAALNGHTVGGGLEIALACDLRLMADGPYK